LVNTNYYGSDTTRPSGKGGKNGKNQVKEIVGADADYCFSRKAVIRIKISATLNQSSLSSVSTTEI
jgi:hypothetical protein